MSSHHQMAIEMASLASRRTRSPQVRPLADGIVRAQRREIGTMTAVDADLARRGA
jgi:uncharacterized protein (DUF305 family)